MADAFTAPIAGAVQNPVPPSAIQSIPRETVEDTVKHAADLVREALDLTSHAVENAITAVSDKIFESAADVGANIASPLPAQQAAQNAFSWGGYFQALGILCLLLALLWFAVWAIRKYGRFNFLPRPGSLPKDSLVMETQMPLGPKKGLMVVRFFDRRLLLGVTEHQITLITEEAAPNERPQKDFKTYMDGATASSAAGKSRAVS